MPLWLLDHELPPLEKPLRERLAQVIGQPVDRDELGQQLRLGQVRPKRLRDRHPVRGNWTRTASATPSRPAAPAAVAASTGRRAGPRRLDHLGGRGGNPDRTDGPGRL